MFSIFLGLHPLEFPKLESLLLGRFQSPFQCGNDRIFRNRVMELLTESQRLTDHTTPAMRDSAEITARDWQHAWEEVAGHRQTRAPFYGHSVVW